MGYGLSMVINRLFSLKTILKEEIVDSPFPFEKSWE